MKEEDILPGRYDKFQHSYSNQNSMHTVED